MDWANERYVRFYTRDTPEWIALGWDAQNLEMQLTRKVDRSGVLDLGKLGPKAVAVVLHQVELWESRLCAALYKLVEDGRVLIIGDKLIIPDFVPQQETPQSDRQRQAESRARRREQALAGQVTFRDIGEQGFDAPAPLSLPESPPNGSHSLPHVFTERDAAVPIRDVVVTKRDGSVTPGHVVSRGVTPSLPSRADPEVPRAGDAAVSDPRFGPEHESSSSGGAPDAGPLVLQLVGAKQSRAAKAKDSAHGEAAAWLEWFNRRFVGPSGSPRRFELRDEVVDAVRSLRAKKFTQEDMRMVALYKRAQWEGRPEMAHLLVPATLLRVKTFGGYLDAARLWFEAEEKKNHG
jgi:hypothetical protein